MGRWLFIRCGILTCPSPSLIVLGSSLALGLLLAGLPVTVETCAHYLTFAAEDIPDSDTRYKCAPPLREREVVDRLWRGLQVSRLGFMVQTLILNSKLSIPVLLVGRVGTSTPETCV